jgi:hypothetical protein
MGIAGHFAHCEFIGDVKHVHTGVQGTITAVLLHVHVGAEAMELAVVLDEHGRWPAALRAGVRLAVKGALRQEREVVHRRNVHYLAASHVAVVPRWPRREACPSGVQPGPPA